MIWRAADKMPPRRLIVFVRDNRATTKITADAIASMRKDGVMVFKGTGFISLHLLGRRVI